MIDLDLIQRALVERNIEGWLLYDFRGSNPLALDLLQIPKDTLLTRRFFYWIPATGKPVKVASRVENPLHSLPGSEERFGSWKELEQILGKLLKNKTQIAMEYSPKGLVPEISRVDAGTVDFVRSFGCEVVSSGDLLQLLSSRIEGEALASHFRAATALDEIAGMAFEFIGKKLDSGVTEWDVRQLILSEMQKRGMMTDHPPICAVNAHSADPHFEPQEGGRAMEKGDFVLIDLWCKEKAPGSIYADITRVASIGKPTDRQREVFSIVKQAQDAALSYVREEYQKGRKLRGCDVDAVCRKVIDQAGYGEYFVHRTGHNIHERDHGPGAHIDSFETQDERELLPSTCFSIEPGIYLPGEFGVRLEFDVFLDPAGQAVVTGGSQDNINEISF